MKPCPFCGAKANLIFGQLNYRMYQIDCDKGHTDGFLYSTKAAAIAAWNTRAHGREILIDEFPGVNNIALHVSAEHLDALGVRAFVKTTRWIEVLE